MKRSILGAGMAAVICLAACGKRGNDPIVSGQVYSGRVVTYVCGNVAVQFTDGTKLGETWTTSDGKRYEHIFKVSNSCTWRPRNGSSDAIKFFFTNPGPQNCAQCLIAVEMPSTEYNILVVE